MRSRLAAFILASAIALPLHAQVLVKSYAQELVDRTVAANPDLLVVVMHATPPKATSPVVVASNIGRLGEPSGEGAVRLISTGRPAATVSRAGHVEVELVMRDVVGDPVGALGLVWRDRAGQGAMAFEKRGEAIRDGLAKRILNAANLMDPFPFEPGATTKTHAQKLVDEVQARQPEVIVLAVRGPPRGSPDIVVLGATFGRHGKKADADDLKILTAAAPATGIFSSGKRFGVDLALHDRSGKTIGTMNVGFRYKPGDDQDALLRKAEAVREDLQGKIGSADELQELDP